MPRLRRNAPIRFLAAALAGCLVLLSGLLPAQESTGTLTQTTIIQEVGGTPDAPAEERERISIVGPLMSEENIAYGMGRTKIVFGERTLEADRIIFDLVTQDAQAEGNVVFTGPQEEIRGTSARYNFRRGEGVAFGVEGYHKDLFFRSVWDEQKNGPSFRKISERESIFRGATYSTCDFPVPHYYVKASEIVLVKDRRVFFRNMTIYVRGVPIFWFPFYSRGFEGSPWSFQVGYMSNLGGFVRIGYRYIHRLRVPSWTDASKYVTKNHGQLDLTADYFFSRGPGAGFDYSYKFDYGRHIGDMTLYGIRDDDRNVGDEDDRENETRYVYRHKHNTMLGRTIWQMNVDEASDPDVYYDILDRFNDFEERGRLFEQRRRFAMSYLREDWLARIMYDRKERLARDRYGDFTIPWDDDLDFDFDPENIGEDVERNKGIPDRYGVVRESLSGRAATSLIKTGSLPFYSRTELNAFRNLDSGFNQYSREDDLYVLGSDIYQSLTNRIRLSPRVTWTNTVGVGAGYYDREDDWLIEGQQIVPDPITGLTDTVPTNALKFPDPTDPSTILIGDSAETISMRDVDVTRLWADYRSRLNARFTETLEGYIQYTVRRGTRDSLGEFYDRVGRVEAREDVYNFQNDYHWVEGFLTYYLLYPNITVNLVGGMNLDSGDRITANEALDYAGTVARYTNDTKEFSIAAGVNYQTRQIRDREDPFEFEQGSINYFAEAEYVPRHGRWWFLVRANVDEKLDDDPLAPDDDVTDIFDENEDKITGKAILGFQVGPKYIVEFSADYDNDIDGDLKLVGITIKRDLHDAEIAVFGGFRNNTADVDAVDEDDDDKKDATREFEFRVSFRLKLPGQSVNVGSSSVKTLRDSRQEEQFVE